MKRNLYRGLLAVVAVLAVAGTAACGPEKEQDAAKGTASASASADPDTSAAGTPGASASAKPDTSKPPAKGGTVELRGTVESGVESGCLILSSGGKTYNLIGGDRSVVKAGATVVVRGTEEPDLMTTCQQGVPFKVTEAYAQ